METPDAPIDRFKDEFGWLSNMHECTCPHADKTFASSEHLYQWKKTAPGWWQDRIFEAPHGKVAKKLAGNPKCPKATHSNWDDFRLQCMEVALRSKFGSNVQLRQQLVDTGTRDLIEGNYWHDQFWGNCTCPKCPEPGLNHLGRMLMMLRSEYQTAALAA